MNKRSYYGYCFQTSELKKELDELRKILSTDSVSQALREVKEYAARSSEVNVDTLQLKLMHLDEIARRTSHDERELYALTLQRFLCHKQHPKIGFLVTSLLSSPAETKLFEKEQKFLKIHGKPETKGSAKKFTTDEKEKKSTSDLEQPYPSYFMPPFFNPMMPLPRTQLPPFQRPLTPSRRGAGRNGPRAGYSGCFKCGDLSHFSYMCNKK